MPNNLIKDMKISRKSLANLADHFCELGDNNNAYAASNASGVFKGAIAEIEQQNDTIDALRSELEDAVGCLFDRGATEYVRVNYPEQYKRLKDAAGNQPRAISRQNQVWPKPLYSEVACTGCDGQMQITLNTITDGASRCEACHDHRQLLDDDVLSALMVLAREILHTNKRASNGQ